MKRRLRKVRIAITYVLAELEALTLSPPTPGRFRRRYLALLGMTLPSEFWIGRHLTISNAHKISVGDRFAIGDNVTLTAHAPITIGREFTGASGLHIDSGGHDVETFEPTSANVTIGDRVWCGIGVTVLAGAAIGDDCVIGAGAVVTGTIPPGSLAVGVPARVIRSIRGDHNKVWSHFAPDERSFKNSGG